MGLGGYRDTFKRVDASQVRSSVGSVMAKAMGACCNMSGPSVCWLVEMTFLEMCWLKNGCVSKFKFIMT